jgi:hypothetical protein
MTPRDCNEIEKVAGEIEVLAHSIRLNIGKLYQLELVDKALQHINDLVNFAEQLRRMKSNLDSTGHVTDVI